MLKIRQKQYKELGKVPLKCFNKRMLDHLQTFWPDRCNQLGREKVQLSIQTGISKAKRYGFRTEYDVARYIDLMYILSFDFDTNPQTRWMKEFLAGNESAPTSRMDKLYEQVELHRNAQQVSSRGHE
jgi:hypothetical protein